MAVGPLRWSPAVLFSAVFTLTLWFNIALCSSTAPRLKFEYKLSFKGPHLIQKDKGVPFWEHGGDAIAGDDNVRITPSLRSKKGWIWSKNSVPHDNWVIEVTFRVTGRGRVGADGLAIWYVQEKGVEGPVFGNNDKWNGLGIFFDSFDNDAQRNNPYILVMLNNGTREYDHVNDGHNQQLGGCLRDFRNKPFPLRAKVEYYKNALTLFINNGMSSNQEEYELCMRTEGVQLPKNGFFGITAATGGLADDHDVLAFLTHSMHAPADQLASDPRVSDDEKKKLEEEFQEYYKKLEQDKEDYKKEHPEKAKDEYDIDADKWFETQGERELKQIFEVQNSMFQVLRELNKRLDELHGRQELVLSKVSSGSGVQMVQGQVRKMEIEHGTPRDYNKGLGSRVHNDCSRVRHQAPEESRRVKRPKRCDNNNQDEEGQPIAIPETIKRHEVEMVIGNQNDIRSQMQDIRQMIDQLKEKAGRMAGGGGVNMDLQMAIHEVKDHVKQVREDTANMLKAPQQPFGSSCPSVSCISPTIFFIGLSVQIMALFVYALYKQNKEARAKKFY